MSRLEMPEYDAAILERVAVYDRAANEHWQYAKDEPDFMKRHCHELQAKQFEWEAEKLRELI